MTCFRLFSLCLLQAANYPEWKAVGPWGGAARVIRLDAQKPDTLMALAMRGTGVFRSRDAAKTWTALPAFPELPNARLDSGLILPGKWLVGAAPGGLWRSIDEGESWQRVPGTEKLSFFALTAWPRDPRVLAAGTNEGVWMSNNAGDTWRRISPKSIDDLSAIVSVAFDPQKAGILFAGTPHLPWKTINGGTSWQKAHIGMFDDSDIFSIVVDPTLPGRVFASACSGIYCSLNSGAAWRRVQGIPGTNRRTYVVTQSPHNPKLLFAGTSAGMWTSSDGGSVWKKLNEYVATSISFHPKDKKLFYASTERHGILKTLNEGASFEPVNTGFASRSRFELQAELEKLYGFVPQNATGSDWFETAVNPFNPDVWLRASRAGLSRSEDSGKTWHQIENGIGKEWIRSISFHPKRKGLCFALRQQRVFWSSDAGETWYWLPAKEEAHLMFDSLRTSEAYPALLFGITASRGVYVQNLPDIR